MVGYLEWLNIKDYAKSMMCLRGYKGLNSKYLKADFNVCKKDIRRTLNNHGVHGRVTKPLLSTLNISANMDFAKMFGKTAIQHHCSH